mgnify:CR=1 FL=1
MAEEDDAQKTEDPTDKKLQKAKDKGQVASSQEIKTWMILLAGTGAMVFMAPSIMTGVRIGVYKFIEAPHAISADFENLRLVMANLLQDMGLVLAPLLLLLLIVAVAANVGQTGLVWAPEKMMPDLSRISLIKGMKTKFGPKALVEFAKGIAKLSLVSLVAFGMALPLLGQIEVMPTFDMVQTLDLIHSIAIKLMFGTVVVMTIIAFADLAYTKYSHKKEMMMSKQEVKDEQKQSDGDPQIKARIRQLRMERAQQRMMAAVPDADVVVTNPTHYAIALEYKMETMPAPKLIAKGVDSLALRIREVAEENDVPVVENPPLARALYAAVELDEEIPEEHFKAVAEVIGYVMALRGEKPGSGSGAKRAPHGPLH